MKVLLVSFVDTGGAGIACVRLHQALLSVGVDSHLLTLHKTRRDLKNHFSYSELIPDRIKPKSDFSRLKSLVKNRLNRSKIQQANIQRQQIKALKIEASKSTDYFSLTTSSYRIDLVPGIETFDVINLHWVGDFLDWSSFFGSEKIKRVVWTLHDMGPFTGGYHYSNGYLGFKEKDENPPFLKNTYNPNFASEQLRLKLDILGQTKCKIEIVALCNWMYGLSSESTLLGSYKHTIIPNSLNTEVFRPMDKAFCKQLFGLPIDKKVLLFVSDSIDNHRKGFDTLVEAIVSLNMEDYVLCGVGKKNGLDTTLKDVYFIDSISDERLMVLAYNMADIFLLPSKEDNLPNVMLEAMSCGVPVVSFALGGMVDVIQEGFNGVLVKDVSAEGFRIAIKSASSIKFDRQNIREFALANYHPMVQAKRYKQIFEND